MKKNNTKHTLTHKALRNKIK